jgi:FixJ family two-component response regulator
MAYHTNVLDFADERRGAPTAPSSLEQRVYIVDDDEGIRDCLRSLVQSVGVAVSSHASAKEFLEAHGTEPAGCLLLDVRLPGMSGLELQAALAARKVRIPIIMITGYADVGSAVSALKAGAMDFVEKPFSRQLLLERINKALEIDRAARRDETQRKLINARVDTLTPRERQVMDLVADGRTNKAIAIYLGLREKTVEVHRAHVMQKMKAGSLAELVRMLSTLGVAPG